ncbi:RICIN domain-containing protein [Kitasatospora sp. NBC_01250]|uniref:RICIN domain-containing protein n=1 Tax=Kitasatospora sp. NBC_01250 TaxID=2903571 RepID=UPI002E373C16|nr:RICIN domain-containing protein [Kitasatospora sp. NBC_01250]
MRSRARSAVLAVSVTVCLGVAGVAQASAHSSADSAAGPRIIKVASVSQIPTVSNHAKVVPNAIYQVTMTNNDRGQCLDGDTNTIPNNGAKVQLWGCNGWSNQTWDWAPAAGYPAGYYSIQNNDRGECLDGDTNTIPNNGAKVQLWGCNGWSNQTWAWGGATLVNADKGECLDGDTNTIPNNGAKVQLWACNGWSNQNWTLHNV